MLTFLLTHWGRVTQICVGKLTNIGSDNGLSPGRRQAIIWTNVGILLIGTLGTNFSEILIDFHTFSFKKMLLKVSSAKRRTFSLGLNVLMNQPLRDMAAANHVYRQTSNISNTLVGNKIDDHSYVVGASPVGTAPNTYSFLT